MHYYEAAVLTETTDRCSHTNTFECPRDGIAAYVHTRRAVVRRSGARRPADGETPTGPVNRVPRTDAARRTAARTTVTRWNAWKRDVRARGARIPPPRNKARERIFNGDATVVVRGTNPPRARAVATASHRRPACSRTKTLLTNDRLLGHGLLRPFCPSLADLFRHLVVKTVWPNYDVKDGKNLPQRELLPDVHLLCRCTPLAAAGPPPPPPPTTPGAADSARRGPRHHRQRFDGCRMRAPRDVTYVVSASVYR